MTNIRFSDEFHAKPPREQIIYLEKLASSQNEALDLMQKERNQLAVRVTTLEAQLKGAENNLMITKNIMQKNLTDTNTEREDRILRVQQLEKALKEKNVIIENLSNKLKSLESAETE